MELQPTDLSHLSETDDPVPERAEPSYRWPLNRILSAEELQADYDLSRQTYPDVLCRLFGYGEPAVKAVPEPLTWRQLPPML